MSVAGVVLAAGASTRLGQPKQLVRRATGETLLENAVRALRGSRCGFRAIVLGAHRGEVEAALDPGALAVLVNDAWPTGMASSIHAAVSWAAPLPCAGLLLLVCDQPLLDAAHLDALVAAFEAGGRTVGSAYADTVGVPAVFDRAAFPELARLPGDRGARALLARPDVASVPWPAGAIDVDTPSDLAHLA